jgi:hypothetical protein
MREPVPNLNRSMRRRMFGRVGGFAVAIGLGVITAACGIIPGTTAPSTATITQVLLDLQGGIGTLKTVVAGAGAYLSTGATGIANQALASATNAFSSLTSTLANVSTATTLQTATGFVSAAAGAVVAALTGVPGATAYLVIAQTVQALLPSIVAWINSIAHPSMRVPRDTTDYRPIRGSLGIPMLAIT